MFKAYEFRNLPAFDFFQLLNNNMFNGTLKIPFLLVLVGNLVIFKFHNFKFD